MVVWVYDSHRIKTYFNLIHLIIFFWIDNCFEGDLCQNRALEKRDVSQTDQMEPINFELESNLWLWLRMIKKMETILARLVAGGLFSRADYNPQVRETKQFVGSRNINVWS